MEIIIHFHNYVVVLLKIPFGRKQHRYPHNLYIGYPPGILGQKKLTPNFYVVTDGNFMEIWDSISSYIGVPFCVKHPSQGFTVPLVFTTNLDFSLAKEREKKNNSK
jgi:hypothetical protein